MAASLSVADHLADHMEQTIEEAAHSLAHHILISASVAPRNINSAANTNTGPSEACPQPSVLVTHKPMTRRPYPSKLLLPP